MNKIKDLFLNKIFKKKKIWIPLVLVFLIIIIILLRPNNNLKNITTDIAQPIDLKQTILATGQVTSNTDLSLSFKTSGVVKSIDVVVGEKVKAGQVLANLDQNQVLANLTSARGTKAAAEARLKRVLEGTEIALAELSLESAKKDYENTLKYQETLVKNAYNNLLNSSPEALPKDDKNSYPSPTISGTYNLGKEGFINLKTYYSSGGMSFNTTGLLSATGLVDNITPQPIGDSGLFIKWASDTVPNTIEWIIEIPNKKAVNYLTNYNAYQLALENKQTALDQAQALLSLRQAEFDLRKITKSGSEIDLAQAEILSADGQLQQAQALYNDTRIIAPVAGTITAIDTKIGELSSALERAIILQDVSNLYIESNVNEANIVGLAIDLPVQITFDSFGPEEVFEGKVMSIDPSSTLISGVVNYKIKVSVDQIDNLKPGMTANMTIKVKEKNNVLAVPSRSILNNKDGTKSIRLINNTKKKKYIIVPVTTGMSGDGGLVEIVEGLTPGEEYVVLINAK